MSVPAKPAKPDRYVVDKIGIPDAPSSEYFVLDVVDNWQHREALAYLGNKFSQRGQAQLSRECFQVLDDTLEAHRQVMEARQPKTKKGGKKEVARP